MLTGASDSRLGKRQLPGDYCMGDEWDEKNTVKRTGTAGLHKGRRNL